MEQDNNQNADKDAAITGLEEKKKSRNVVTNLLLRMGEKAGIIERTRLSPEFLTHIDKYAKYQNIADGLVERIEGCLQMNPKILAEIGIEAPEREDPYEIFARAIKHFRSVMPEEKKQPLIVAEAIAKRLALMQRENQRKSRRAIRKLRRFVSHEYEAMINEQKRLMNARDIMDSARHDLKQTRTSAEVEDKGKIYEQAVHEFDVQSDKIMEICENLTNDKMAHQREVLDLFELEGRNHKLAATMLADHLERLGV